MKIMCVGDSITNGLNSANPGGYRAELFDKITRHLTYTPSFVGWQTNGACGDASFWCGLSGERTDECRARTIVQAPAFQPDIVFLHIGTNDTTQLSSTAGPNTVEMSMGYLNQILDDFRAANPNCIVFVCTIIDHQTYGAAVVTYNTALLDSVALRADYASDHVLIVDMYDALGAYNTTSWLSGDPTHPREAGYSIMATTFYNAFIAKGF